MNPWKGLIAFVQRREDATSLALTRIVLGATITGNALHTLINGAATFAWTDQHEGGIGSRHGWLLELLGGATERNVLALAVLLVIAAAFTTVGLFTRASVVVTYLLFRALVETNLDARGAYDTLIVNILVLLVLSGCGRALSVDARIFQRSHLVAQWPRRLLVLQMGLLYGGSALMKASSGWVPGGDASALWYILHQPLWARFGDVPTWAWPITQLSTTTVWLWELFGPLFVLSVVLRERDGTKGVVGALKRGFDRVRFREIYLVIGVIMHLGIEATMEVGPFTFASLSLYFCGVRPDEWRAFFTRLRSLV